MMGKTDHDLLKALIADVKEIKSHLLGSAKVEKKAVKETLSETLDMKSTDKKVEAVDQVKGKAKDITMDSIKDDKGAKK